jgi:formylglycine-generating enzyme required for sulfatase activity
MMTQLEAVACPAGMIKISGLTFSIGQGRIYVDEAQVHRVIGGALRIDIDRATNRGFHRFIVEPGYVTPNHAEPIADDEN